MEFLRKNIPIITLGILVIGLLAYIESRFGRLETELRSEIKAVRTELKADIVAVRTELKEEIQAISHKLDTLILTISHQKQAHSVPPKTPNQKPSSTP